MGSDSLLVFAVALVPMLLTTALWCFVTHARDDEMSDCLASGSASADR